MKLASWILGLILVCSATVCLNAQGVVIVEKETANGQSATNQIQMDASHIRAESKAAGMPVAFIFDAQKQTALMIDMNKKTYMEMTKADTARGQQQVDAAQAQIEERLKNLPPQQRQIAEQMLRGRGLPGAAAPQAAAQAPKIEYRPAGSGTVGQWKCNKYEGYVGQQKTVEVCTVDPKALGLTPSDFDVARKLADFMKSMSPQAADRLPFSGTAQDGYTGVPVRHTSYRNGTVDTVSEFVEVRHVSLPSSTFDPPAGFTKSALGRP